MSEVLPPTIGLRLRRTDAASLGVLSELQLSSGEAIPFSKLNHVFGALADGGALMQAAWEEGCLEVLDNVTSPNLVGYTSSANLSLDLSPLERSARWRLSRFALMRRESGDQLILESARTGGKVVVHGAVGILAYYELRRPLALDELERAIPSAGKNGAGMLFVLRATGMIVSCHEDADSETKDEHLAQWELHDMMFHMQSRLVRADQRPTQYRFRDQLSPQPAIKPNPWAHESLDLPRVDLQSLVQDPPLTSVLEGRRSVRVGQTSQPISLDQLAEFLFRVARIRNTSTNEFGEFATRPYPTAGACYELEIYLAIDRCRGLSRGLYYYDALRHAISGISVSAGDLNELLSEAWRASGERYVPQVLIVIASRFQRVAWKYGGTAYANQLKDVGVLMQTMYLVATAMGLAPCALGGGDATLFSRLTKLDPLREGSVGEFLLGAG